MTIASIIYPFVYRYMIFIFENIQYNKKKSMCYDVSYYYYYYVYCTLALTIKYILANSNTGNNR